MSQVGVTMALWTLAAAGVTVFKILANTAKNALQPAARSPERLLDQKALNFWAMAQPRLVQQHP